MEIPQSCIKPLISVSTMRVFSLKHMNYNFRRMSIFSMDELRINHKLAMFMDAKIKLGSTHIADKIG